MTHLVRFQNGRLAEDLRGAFVTMPYQNRTLLGEVTAIRYREHPAGFMATVRHFNGEDWPYPEVSVGCLRVLDQTKGGQP